MNSKKLSPFCSASLIALGATLSTIAFADDAPNPNDIRMTEPVLSGTGCPAGSASSVLSPDGKSLSILFDAFQVQVGGNTGNMTDRKSCAVDLPLHVPQGYVVAVSQIDYRGFNALPEGARSQFDVEYFFSGRKDIELSRSFLGPVSSDFIFHSEILGQSMIWSGCGTDLNLRAQANVIVQTNANGAEAQTSVDSLDAQASLVYRLQWQRCGNNQAPGTYQGACTIEAERPGSRNYVVRNKDGRIIGHAGNYPDAIKKAMKLDQRGDCGIYTGGGSGGAGGNNPPPAPDPTPAPQPQPQPQQPLPPQADQKYQCALGTRYGLFTGSGRDKQTASNAARNSCLTNVIDSQVCYKAPMDCFKMF